MGREKSNGHTFLDVKVCPDAKSYAHGPHVRNFLRLDTLFHLKKCVFRRIRTKGSPLAGDAPRVVEPDDRLEHLGAGGPVHRGVGGGSSRK